MPNSVRFHRVLKASPERVYRAFLDAEAMVKWLPPNGFTGKVHHLDAKVAELRNTFSELGKLVGSTRAEVENIGQQHDWPLLERLREVEGFGAADWQLEIRGRVAYCKWGHR